MTVTYSLDRKRWFQIIARCWRPFQQWGFAGAAVAYAFKPVLGYAFSVEVFAALAAAAGAGFIARGVEKAVKTHSVAKHAPTRLSVDIPPGGA